MRIILKNTIVAGMLSILLTSCYKEEIESGLLDWRDETHTDIVEPNFEKVFDQTRVNRIDLVFTESNFSQMDANFSSLVASNDTETNPSYFSCNLFFNGIQWYDVGVRYRGNNKSFESYQAGNGKLPIKLDFDKFEDTNEEIANQRFFGFNELTLNPNFNDNSQIREKLSLDLFREFGVPAPRTSFYKVYVDKGDGSPVYFGLYTMVENLLETFLKNEFINNTGNFYEAQGAGSKFYSDQFELDDFVPKTNQETTLKEDVQELYEVLNASTRTTNLEQWKQDLEAVFDVDGFLKYLAVNNSIQNWDSYGTKRGNYYLYHDPSDDLLKWVVRNTNESFKSEGDEPPVSLSMLEVTIDWPLINYLIRIPEYEADYQSYLSSFSSTLFTATNMDNLLNALEQTVAPASKEELPNYTHINGGTPSFESEYTALKAHVYQRIAALESYLQ